MIASLRTWTSFFVVCLLGFSSAALGQRLSLGVIGGVSLTQDFQNRRSGNVVAYSTPRRWIAGGMVEVRLPLNLSVEFDALYHELELTSATVQPNGTLSSVSPSPVVTWEFPLLVKYRFSFRIMRPFVQAGPSFRSSGNLNGSRIGL